MARMIPQNIARATRSNAEKILFRILEENLDDNYVVFHSAWWQSIKFIVQDREADFIIVHPEQGILIIEAKSGIISYNHLDKKWFQNNKELKISPFKQARNIKFRFLDFLTRFTEFEKKDFIIGQSVTFTDIDDIERGLPSEAPSEILLLRSDLNRNIQANIEGIFAYYKAKGCKRNLGKRRVQKIINLISPSTTFKKYMINDLGNIEEKLYQLTHEQFIVLDNIWFQKKAIILGCAGSGKTQLAIEQAKRKTNQKKRTLLTCRSYPLSQYLYASLKSEIETCLCNVQNFRTLKDNLREDDFLYDVIIVDEGQDFSNQEILYLNSLLTDDGSFYLFKDSNQNVYRQTTSSFTESVSTLLTKNCRNTKKIFDYVSPFVNCNHPLRSSNITGKDVIEKLFQSDQELLELINQDLIQLIHQHKVPTGKITLITDVRSSQESLLNNTTSIGSFSITKYKNNNYEQESIYWSTATDYKGLENTVVIFIEERLRNLVPTSWDISSQYVGLTRAVSWLIVYKRPEIKVDI